MVEENDSVEYQPIEGFPGYRVGNDGTIWSCWSTGGKGPRQLTAAWRIKAPQPSGKRGYYRVLLRRADGKPKHCYVHVVVLRAFVGPCPEKMEGCHKDDDPKNNYLTNLRWDTKEGNAADRKRNGNGSEGCKQPQAKLTEEAVKDIRAERKRGVTLKVLSQRHGVSMAKISQVARGQNWTHVINESEMPL